MKKDKQTKGQPTLLNNDDKVCFHFPFSMFLKTIPTLILNLKQGDKRNKNHWELTYKVQTKSIVIDRIKKLKKWVHWKQDHHLYFLLWVMLNFDESRLMFPVKITHFKSMPTCGRIEHFSIIHNFFKELLFHFNFCVYW